MSLMLGTYIQPEIEIVLKQYTLEILKEIKHYLTLQTNVVLIDNNFTLKIQSFRKITSSQKGQTSSATNQYCIPKNFAFLYSHYQKIHIETQEDLQFFDICYECLMIIKEYLVSKIEIQVQITEEFFKDKNFSQSNQSGLSLYQFVQNLQKQKNQEFSRRVNSNFKAIASQKEASMVKFQIQNMLHLAQNYLFYKNKVAAIKFLASNPQISRKQFALIHQKSIQFLQKLAIDDEFKADCSQIIEKIIIGRQIVSQKKQNQQDYQGDQEGSDDERNNAGNYDNGKQKGQKQFRLSNNSKAHGKSMFQSIRTEPLKSHGHIFVKQQALKNDRLSNMSVKNLLFQLRQSTSLKRLSMLINCASEMKIQGGKYPSKIEKQIENICKNFIKNNYGPRYHKEMKIQDKLGDSIKYPNINKENMAQLNDFYQCLVSYFSRNKLGSKNSQITDINKGVIRWKNSHQILENISQQVQLYYYSGH